MTDGRDLDNKQINIAFLITAFAVAAVSFTYLRATVDTAEIMIAAIFIVFVMIGADMRSKESREDIRDKLREIYRLD